jgi:hypothetical protein
MTVNIAGKSVSYASLAALVGGILAIVGAVLPWATYKGTSLNGLDEGLLGGKVALVLGVVIAAVVVAGILKVKIPQSGAILAILGAAILVVLVLVYFTKILSDMSFKDLIDLTGASLGVGVILEVVGGILAIVGGAMIYLKKA